MVSGLAMVTIDHTQLKLQLMLNLESATLRGNTSVIGKHCCQSLMDKVSAGGSHPHEGGVTANAGSRQEQYSL
jgi:hypothetical protein